MVWRSAGSRYETGEKKVNEVDFISQGVESSSENQLDHEMVDRFVVVVVKAVLECRHWKSYCVYQEWWRCCELEWWFEQDIDVEEKKVEEDENGGEV
ncbi:hypothetical protein Tco_1524129 [Tanacetum coccineum]